MLASIQNIFSIPDLRKRVIFTFLMLAVYRIGIYISTPGVDRVELGKAFLSHIEGCVGVVSFELQRLKGN